MRFLRHLIAPMVAYLVASGYLPDYMAGDITEALVLAFAFAVPYAWSWLRDLRREAQGRGVKCPE